MRRINTVQCVALAVITVTLAVTVPVLLALGLTVWLVGYLTTRGNTGTVKRAPSGTYVITDDTGVILHAGLSAQQARDYVLTGTFDGMR